MRVNKEELYQFIAEVLECDVESVQKYPSIRKNYKWDSLSHINIIVSLEDYYQIQIPDKKIIDLVHVESIYDYLLKEVESKKELC
jgi:acyl carrier protein